MEQNCEREVTDLHRFFVDWLSGALPKTEAAFARCSDVLAEGFALISPRGVLTERAALIGELKAAHGSLGGSEPPFVIEVRNFRNRRTDGELCLVTYEEWQQREVQTTGRLSSAWFRARKGTPNGVEWLHVHETWLPQANPTR